MARVINMTPHDVAVYSEDGSVVKVYRKLDKNTIATRVIPKEKKVRDLQGFKVVTQEVERAINLPEQQDNTYYIVSARVRLAYPERKDLLSPNTNRSVYSAKGRKIGVYGFVSN